MIKAFIQLFFIFGVSQLWGQISPVNLICSDKTSTIGVHEPYFGWQIESLKEGQSQTAYQVLVASSREKLNKNEADIWNSGKVLSGSQNYVYFTGTTLKSAKQYYWKVKLWDKNNVPGVYSTINTFATGLLTNVDWDGAKWIKRENNDNEDYTYYRRKFMINNPQLVRAMVYVTAVHDYEFYVNGKLAGRGPGYHYPQYQFYKVYDITSLVNNDSENIFACLTHWYGGGQGRPTSSRGFLLKAIFEYADGSKSVIGTDFTWKQKQAETFVTGQPPRNGEGIGFIDKIDSRKVINNWNAIAFDDASWDNSIEIGPQPVSPWNGLLQPNFSELIEQKIVPQSVKPLGNGSYVIDLGKVYAGIPDINFEGGNQGDSVTILGGFTLTDDGKVSTKTNQGTNMSYSFILNGDKAVFKPIIYLGMRYIQVDNSPCALTKDNVAFITRHYELDPSVSSFISSNNMLNQVYGLMKHSVIVGTQESFVDTPTREKGGFLGDSWSIGTSAMHAMNDGVMNLQVLNQFLCSQDQYWPDGRMNAVYPNVDGKRDIPDYTQMFLFYVWDYYMQTGNKEFVKKNFDQIQKVASYVENYINSNTGLVHNLAGGKGPYEYGIIDWPAVMRYGYDMEVESRTVVDVYAYLDFQIMAKIAAEIDFTDIESRYDKLASEMKSAINTRLINDQGIYIDGLNKDLTPSMHASQHANMLPYAAGIVPEDYNTSVINKIKADKMSVGMVTLKWLPQALGEANEGEHLFELYTNTSWDGWAKTVALGGTTTWEAWNANESGESMSHPWGAVGLIGIHQYFLGVKALQPQYEKIQVKPLWFGDKLNFVEGNIPTSRGSISIDWKKTDTSYTLKLMVPNNISAEVYIPANSSIGNLVLVNGVEKICEKFSDYYYIGELTSGTYEISRRIVSQDSGKPDNAKESDKKFKKTPRK